MHTTTRKTESALRATIFTMLFVGVLCTALTTTSCSMFQNNDGEASDSVVEKTSSLIDITTVTDSDTVFICTGKASKRFHSSDSCEGIMQCTKEIIPITRADAEKRHRSFCHKCYRDSIDI